MNDRKPLVTAIITTHNRLNLLKRAIESVKAQTYPEIELIVVDDASDDGTEEYCRNGGFTYIRIDKKDSRGGNHARNLGIEAATGEYIGFCDDDDYWLPGRIEKQVALIEETGYGFVHCARRAEIVTRDNVVFNDLFPTKDAEGDISKSILWTIHCLTSTLLIKKELLNSVGGFDENLRAWQEHDLTIRMAQLSKTAFVNEPLVVYRVDRKDSQRLTNKYYPWKTSVQYLLRKHKDLISQLNIMERIRIKLLVSTDGIGRAQAAGLSGLWYWHRFLTKMYSTILRIS